MNISANKRAKLVRQALAANVKVNVAWAKLIDACKEKCGTTCDMTLAHYLDTMIDTGIKCGEKVVKLAPETGCELWKEIDHVVRTEARAYLRGVGLKSMLPDYCGRECWKEVA